MSEQTVVIDATNQILGRMASFAAKTALQGKNVVIVNAEKAVISGRRKSILEEAMLRLKTRTLASQEKAPTHPRRPDQYVHRVVRGMLPWRKPRGKQAFHRIRVFIGLPEEFSSIQPQRIKSADASKLRGPYITVNDLSGEIGGIQP